MLNVGLPEGVLTSFVYQPIGYVRLNAGLGFNAISPSLSVGVSGHPLGYSWGPSFGIDYGHYFEGDASGLVEVLTGPIESNVSPMKNVGYDYVNFRLGMEYGGERFVFFGRGGVSWIGTEIHALNELIEAEAAASEGDVPSTTSVKFTHDPVLSIWAPSLSFGMIVRL